jgi:hypothetical protein
VLAPDRRLFHRFPVHEPFESYLRASGYGSADRVASAAEVWGLNRFDVPVPPFLDLLREQMLAPFFVFQIFCVGLWCLDEYWWVMCVSGGVLACVRTCAVSVTPCERVCCQAYAHTPLRACQKPRAWAPTLAFPGNISIWW